MFVVVTELCLTLLQPYGLQPVRLLCPWDCPGKNTGEGCHFLLQGIFPGQESNLLLAGRFLITEPPGKPNRDPTGVKLACDIHGAPEGNPRDLFLYWFEYQGSCCSPFFCRPTYANVFFRAKLFKYHFPYPVDMLYPGHSRKNIRKQVVLPCQGSPSAFGSLNSVAVSLGLQRLFIAQVDLRNKW